MCINIMFLQLFSQLNHVCGLWKPNCVKFPSCYWENFCVNVTGISVDHDLLHYFQKVVLAWRYKFLTTITHSPKMLFLTICSANTIVLQLQCRSSYHINTTHIGLYILPSRKIKWPTFLYLYLIVKNKRCFFIFISFFAFYFLELSHLPYLVSIFCLNFFLIAFWCTLMLHRVYVFVLRNANITCLKVALKCTAFSNWTTRQPNNPTTPST